MSEYSLLVVWYFAAFIAIRAIPEIQQEYHTETLISWILFPVIVLGALIGALLFLLLCIVLLALHGVGQLLFPNRRA